MLHSNTKTQLTDIPALDNGDVLDAVALRASQSEPSLSLSL